MQWQDLFFGKARAYYNKFGQEHRTASPVFFPSYPLGFDGRSFYILVRGTERGQGRDTNAYRSTSSAYGGFSGPCRNKNRISVRKLSNRITSSEIQRKFEGLAPFEPLCCCGPNIRYASSGALSRAQSGQAGLLGPEAAQRTALSRTCLTSG